MKLQDQVCTLEQAKRLKELGVNEISYFTWYSYDDSEFVDNRDSLKYNSEAHGWDFEDNIELAAAFTVAELGVMLPMANYGESRRIHKASKGWEFTMKTSDWKDWETYDTEAEARAAMLIHLIEQGAITADEVNARLTQTTTKI